MRLEARRIRLVLVVVTLALAGCATSEPVIPPPADSASSLLTPMDVVAQFRDTVGGEQIPAAMAMVDVMDHGVPAQEQVRQRLSALGREMADNRYDFRPVDAKSEGDAALVIVKETAGKRSPGNAGAVFNAMFLIRRDGAWRISPEPTRYDRIRGLSTAQVANFESLDRWFQYRKADLKLEARDGGN